jgi:hypothetical protein
MLNEIEPKQITDKSSYGSYPSFAGCIFIIPGVCPTETLSIASYQSIFWLL